MWVKMLAVVRKIAELLPLKSVVTALTMTVTT